MVEKKEEEEWRTRTPKTLSNARVAFDVSLFSCERFLRSKRVRARFVTPSPNALTNALTNNASGFVSDDDDANDKKNNNKNKNERRSTDDERAIAFVDQSSGDSCLLYTSPSPRDRTRSRMPSSA